MSVPSEDMRAVGISISPVVPKSDAIDGTAIQTHKHGSTSRFITKMLTRFEPLKKGIRDALFRYCDAHQLPEVPVVVVVVVVVVPVVPVVPVVVVVVVVVAASSVVRCGSRLIRSTLW